MTDQQQKQPQTEQYQGNALSVGDIHLSSTTHTMSDLFQVLGWIVNDKKIMKHLNIFQSKKKIFGSSFAAGVG